MGSPSSRFCIFAFCVKNSVNSVIVDLFLSFVAIYSCIIMTSIRYFIPDDGDTEDEPNVFLAPKCPSAPKLADIKSSFPLPGKYHFRFKINLGGDNGLAVWMDCVDDRKPVPMYRNNMIIAKVTRISADDFSDDEDYDDDDDDMEFE